MAEFIKAQLCKSRKLVLLGFVFEALLFMMSIVLCFWRGFSTIESMWVFNIGADVVAIAVCAIIYFGLMMDMNGVNEHAAMLSILVIVNSCALFFDECSWILQGLARYAFLNRVDNALLFANGGIVIYLFSRTVGQMLELNDQRMTNVKKVLHFLLLPDVLAKLANIFVPIHFYVDEAGYYQRWKFFGFTYVYMVIVMFAFAIELAQSQVSLRQKNVAVSFITIPVVNQILVARTFGISTQYSATMLSIVLIYCVLFADRGKTLAATEQELNTAAAIQAHMLPGEFPAFPGRQDFDIYAKMDPAKEVGGDFYDFFLIDEDHLGVLIADVSGKGVPAALLMMASKILLQNYAMAGCSPAMVLQEANERLCANNTDGMFVTVWLGILDLRTGVLTAANAGHEYPVLHRAGQAFELFKDKHGLVLGAMEGVRYREYEIEMAPGDEIFVYTDGVPEATNSANELYGTERMLRALNRAGRDASGAASGGASGIASSVVSPQELLAAVRKDVDEFVHGAPQFDDLTMLYLRYYGQGFEKW